MTSSVRWCSLWWRHASRRSARPSNVQRFLGWNVLVAAFGSSSETVWVTEPVNLIIWRMLRRGVYLPKAHDANSPQFLFPSNGGSRKKYLGAWPLIIWEAQRLSEITIGPIKNFGGLGKIWGAGAPWPQHRTATVPPFPSHSHSFSSHPVPFSP